MIERVCPWVPIGKISSRKVGNALRRVLRGLEVHTHSSRTLSAWGWYDKIFSIGNGNTLVNECFREKLSFRTSRPSFVYFGSVEGETLRPAACRVDRPDLIKGEPAGLAFVSLWVLPWLAVCHLVVLCDSAQGGEVLGRLYTLNPFDACTGGCRVFDSGTSGVMCQCPKNRPSTAILARWFSRTGSRKRRFRSCPA